MKQYKICDLLDISILYRLAEAQYRISKIPVGIIDAFDGSILMGIGWQDICLRYHRVHPLTLENCIESDNFIKEKLISGEECGYKCRNGLWDVGVPIMTDAGHLATLFFGQFFYEGEIPDREYFRRRARELDFDEAEYLAALDRVPVLSREKVDHILGYNKALALFISDLCDRAIRKLRAEEESRTSRERLSMALVAAGQGFYDLDLRTGNAEISPEYAAMLGYDVSQFHPSLDTWTEQLHPDDRDRVLEVLRAAVQMEVTSYSIEYRHRTSCGDWKWILSQGRISEIDESGRPLRMTGIHTDITARKQAEEKLKTSLREKEILLREIHHRVKNNLQIVSSLLDLQSDYVSGERTLGCLRESRMRIESMALVHEKLYRTGNFAVVDFSGYIRDLCGQLHRSYSGGNDKLTLTVDAGEVSLAIDQAVPCGLIISELVCNCFKHAFPGMEEGEIAVGIRDDGSDGIVLTVSDNGAGLPKGLDFRHTDSLGLQIVNLLTRQLNGTLEVQNGNGATFVLRFKSAQSC